MNPANHQDSAEATTLDKLRHQLSTEREAMQEKEASLRKYEERIRLLVDHASQPALPQATTQQYRFNNGSDQAGLDAAWEKHNRAHALHEAARRALCEDRMALKEREAEIEHRMQEVTRRETRVETRERELAEKLTALPQTPKPAARSAPLAAARQMFSFGKSR